MRNIDLDTLDIFRTVVREGGILRAAEKLHRVQSNVTTRIKQMEQRLGVTLFRRQGRRLVLTEAGQTLLTHADRLLKFADEAEEVTRGAALAGPLRIGSMESTAASHLPGLLSTVHQQHPDIRLMVETGTTDALIRRVGTYELDAAFVGEPHNIRDLNARPVFREELVLISSRTRGAIRRPQDLQGDTLLFFARGCAYRACLERWLAAGGVGIDRAMDFTTYQAIIACAAAGTGVGIMPRRALETQAAAREIRAHTLPDDVAQNTTHLVWQGEISPKLGLLMDVVPGV